MPEEKRVSEEEAFLQVALKVLDGNSRPEGVNCI